MVPFFIINHSKSTITYTHLADLEQEHVIKTLLIKVTHIIGKSRTDF